MLRLFLQEELALTAVLTQLEGQVKSLASRQLDAEALRQAAADICHDKVKTLSNALINAEKVQALATIDFEAHIKTITTQLGGLQNLSLHKERD